MSLNQKTIMSMLSGLLLCASSLFAAVISVENSGSHYDTDSGTATNAISGFTVAEGSNRKLVLTVNYEDADTISSVTYGSQFFTFALDNETTRAASIWYLDAPMVGAADIVVTFTGTARSHVGVVSLQNTATGGPVISAFAAIGATSINLTTPEADTFVIGSYVENGNGPITVSPFSNILYSNGSGSSFASTGYQNEVVAGLKTYAWVGNEASGGITVAGFSAVPEPATISMLSFGALAVFTIRRLRM